MPEVYRTDNPLQYKDLDGVIVTEKSPPPTVVSAGSNNCIFIGQFERGPVNSPRLVASISELQSIFGNNPVYSGNKALRLKKWSNLYVTRAIAVGAVKAKWTQTVSTQNRITFTAKYQGAYGNKITINISNGSTTNTKKVTVGFGDILEVYDNLELAGKNNNELAEIFKASTLVDVTNTHASSEPDNVSNQKLATGTDGAIAATDYTTALQNSNVRVSGKIFFTDDQSAGVKAALSNFVKLERTGQCILGPVSLNTTVAEAITEFNLYKDNEGRVLFFYNPLKLNVEGVIEEESPVFMAASILNLLPPHKDPSAATSVAYTQTAVDTKFNLQRGDQRLLLNAGINSFENDADLGIKLVSGQTGNPAFSILRRRMSDFYINSVARFLKNYQGEPNSQINRSAIRAAIMAFDESLVFNGILPGNDEVETGKAVSIRTEGITSDTERAEGILKVEIKRRLFAASRFIVLIATIAESVVVEEV